ncbi:MAG: hypothetical protein IPK19_37245 [Chloroflexi bacterium]|nr:hypothetical protein [Chloroflexota bacterium]
MRSTRLVLVLALMVGLFAAVAPAMAAPGATIDSLVVNTTDCTLTVTYTVQDAGNYYLQIWDDGTLEIELGGATAAGATVVYTLVIGPVAQGIPGIGVYIIGDEINYDYVDPYNPDFGDCSGDSWEGGATAAVSASCPNPTPADFVVRSIPAGALAFYEPSTEAYAGFNLPVSQTWFTGTAEDGFVEVWIACQADNVFVPAENVVG